MRKIIAILAIACAFAQAQTTRTTVDPDLLKKLQSLDEQTATIKDMSATFKQEKHTPLLKKPMVSTGEVRASGNTMLWLTETPEKTRLRVDEKSLQLYYVANKIVEVYPVEGKLAALAANPIPRLKSLLEQFNIAREPTEKLQLRLTPIDATLKEHVAYVIVELDEKQGVVKSFELTDPDGERTKIWFDGYSLNKGLSASDLELGTPADVKIVHPLERSP